MCATTPMFLSTIRATERDDTACGLQAVTSTDEPPPASGTYIGLRDNCQTPKNTGAKVVFWGGTTNTGAAVMGHGSTIRRGLIHLKIETDYSGGALLLVRFAVLQPSWLCTVVIF
jgi:hypothetical protein